MLSSLLFRRLFLNPYAQHPNHPTGYILTCWELWTKIAILLLFFLLERLIPLPFQFILFGRPYIKHREYPTNFGKLYNL